MKKRWWITLFFYLGCVLIGTLAVQGRSLFEWVHLLVPPGHVRELLLYPLQHHNPVTFEKFLRLADTFVNILLFFPFGMGIFLVFHRMFPDSVRKILFTALFAGLFLSSCIEIFQGMVPNRVSSVSDIVANIGGSVFGCYFLYVRSVRRTMNAKDAHPTNPNPCHEKEQSTEIK